MFTKADFERNEDNNYHTENGVEIAKHFGTKEEQELMAKIAKDHYDRGYINPEEIEARNGIVNKYFHMLEQAQPIKEDETDNEKKSAIYNLRMSLQSLKDEVNELADLDNKPNASGRGDLHDQLATMDKLTSSFEAVLGRAYDIVPGDDVIESKKQIDEGYEGAIIHALQQHDINGFFNKGTLYIEDGADMNTVEEIVNQTVEIAPEIKPENDYYQIEGKYKNDAQRKAVHASKAEKLKEEPIQVREGGSPWTTTGKHPEKMTPDELWTEIAVFDEMKDRGEHLSPKDMMRLDSLFSYMDTAEMNEAIKRKADSMMESAKWKAKRQ